MDILLFLIFSKAIYIVINLAIEAGFIALSASFSKIICPDSKSSIIAWPALVSAVSACAVEKKKHRNIIMKKRP